MRPLIRVAGAAMVGRSHEKEHQNCQDAVYCWRGSDKISACIALSDGAGSRPYSALGANLVVRLVPNFIMELGFDTIFTDTSSVRTQLAGFLQSEFRRAAAEHSVEYADLAATLLFAFVRRRRSQVQYLVGHIGDGVIARDDDDGIEVVSQPDTGEFCNSTCFITSDDMEDRLRIRSGLIRGGATGFLLMSDGAAEALYVRRLKAMNMTYCRQMLEWCKRYPRRKVERILLTNLRFGVFREVTNDDCSIALLRVIG